MKESELRKRANCSRCCKPLGAKGQIQFFVVTVQSYVMNFDAMVRQDGLAAMLGSSRLAGVMGPNEDMANAVGEPDRMTLCQGCAIDSRVLSLVEEVANRREAQRDLSGP